MSNVLDDTKQQQIRALARLGWTLSRIQEATGLRLETIGGHLKAAGIAVRSRGRPSESKPRPGNFRGGVRRFVLTLRGTSSPEARVVIATAPGKEGKVDSCDGPMVRPPQTGTYRRTQLFVFTLGCSRKAVRLLVWQSSAQVWAELHERTFGRLGGRCA